ncbi:DUF4913 domain-containing protein [Streptomyces parvus]|uniref:DUF4913 domain-containing protein n=1 Tax=Streptomyces parvus TaxID=66428 RepID=UPI0036A5166A
MSDNTDPASVNVGDLAPKLRNAVSRIGMLEEYVEWAQPLLEDWEEFQKKGSPSPQEKPPEKQKEKPKPQFSNLVDWVQEWFIPTFQRRVGGGNRWCLQWWAHAEAQVRFDALWRSWEVCRLDPGIGLAGWLRDYLDPQLDVLLSSDGPFSQCAADRHEPLKELPAMPAPAELVDALKISTKEQSPTE